MLTQYDELRAARVRTLASKKETTQLHDTFSLQLESDSLYRSMSNLNL